jgi:hypothetical protein
MQLRHVARMAEGARSYGPRFSRRPSRTLAHTQSLCHRPDCDGCYLIQSSCECSRLLLACMNAQFEWRVSPAAFMSAERRLSLDTTAEKLHQLQACNATRSPTEAVHNEIHTGSVKWMYGVGHMVLCLLY